MWKSLLIFTTNEFLEQIRSYKHFLKLFVQAMFLFLCFSLMLSQRIEQNKNCVVVARFCLFAAKMEIIRTFYKCINCQLDAHCLDEKEHAISSVVNLMNNPTCLF